jgi:RNA 3'-phosphate cyclase
VGTAGALTLLLQSVLLACLTSGEEISLELRGGTDVLWAPPCDYLTRVLLPYFSRLGEVEIQVRRRGFHPKGQGQLEIRLKGTRTDLPPLEWTEQPAEYSYFGRSVSCESLRDRRVAERQAEAAREILPELEIECEYARTPSTGSVLTLWGESHGEWPCRVGSDLLGSKGVAAEEVGRKAARQLQRRLHAPEPVEVHLADNLIPFLALFGGKLLCQEVTPHTRGNAYVMEQFLPVRFQIGQHEVSCERS